MTRPSLACVLLAVAISAGCSKSDAGASGGAHAASGKGLRGGGGKFEYPVQVAPLEPRKLQYVIKAPGSIEAFQQVQITARVAGAVDTVAFKEGEVVKQGQVLVAIESERYKVAVDQAKAALAKAEASEKSNQEQLARRKAASDEHPGLIPGEEIATHETSLAMAQADVESARQALRVAQLNLRDSYVRAPIAGVVQTRTVQTGQYLGTGAVLATILQREPLLLRFSVSEQDAPRLKPGMPVTLSLRESSHAYHASITLVSGAADVQTRLVPVTAQIDDGEHQYWLRPGAFCEVTIVIGAARDAIVVPTVSVEPTEKGNIVFVVENGVAKSRPVALGMHTADGAVEVTRGLGAGEMLVVRGIEPLSDGAPVKIAEKTTLAAATSAADAGAAAPADSAAAADSPATAAPTTSQASLPRPRPAGSAAGEPGRHGRRQP